MGICRRRPPPALLLAITLLLSLTSAATLPSEATTGDTRTLLAFKSAADTAGRLSTWTTDNGNAGPCGGGWYGVSCVDGRVSRLVLEGLSLSGSSSAQLLSILDQLRVLSLKRNQFSGLIPDFSSLNALKLLFLSDNSFSGPVPASLGSLSRLYRLDLSANNLSGPIPSDALSKGLTHLLTLRLDHNRLSGPISALRLPNLQDFNVSGNVFSGAVPAALALFPSSAFQGNPGLCGPPVTAACGAAAAGGVVASDPTRPGVPGDRSGVPLTASSTPAAQAVVSSTPGSMPDDAGSAAAVAPGGGNGEAAVSARKEQGGHMSRAVVVAIVVGDFAILVLVTGLLFCYFWKKYSGNGGRSRLQEGEKIVYSSSPYTSQYGGGGGGAVGSVGAAGPGGGVGGFERGKMVFFEGTKRFELEDLLRASAEMLGKGGYGTAYKAVLDDGSVVAVKRLREAAAATGPGAAVGKREFEQHMEVLGRLRHPNVVSLKAYYYARDEKLLVYEFMPNGSLFALLHGNRGPGRTPLDWTTRMRVAAGTARGLAFIHHHSSRKLAHGNIKSTNVLIDKSGNARVSDLGLPLLISHPHSNATSSSKYAVPNNGYRAPEQASSSSKPPSHKADVYAFGVLLLELLTGRYPSQPADGTIPAAAGSGAGGGVVDLPRWVQSVVREEWTAEVFDLELMRYKDIEEEMVGMLQVAMACTAPVPDQRPGMPSVLKMIEEIRGGETSPSHESFDSVSDSPSVSDPDAAVSV